jgi:DNA-binding SARP family transcriptional activator
MNAAPAIRLELLGAFRLSAGERLLTVPMASERLLAFLALSPTQVARTYVAGTLWPDVSQRHALANLRSALWRLDTVVSGALMVGPGHLSMSPCVHIDVVDARSVARRLINPALACRTIDLSPRTLQRLSVELLPGWYEDWVVAASDSWRQCRLHALEALAERFAAAGRFAEGLEAANAAVQAEPFRETAHSTLIRVHLAEGNASEALRQFECYQKLIRTELGIAPSRRLASLVGTLRLS